ncbi:hypothetical protein QBC32DRAFT_121123 [Pseudoneurospora amorphoporcata]|uniref:FYVE-type domain-containing protein n=1 Tax=Pseudoneurospora amorphoporcata TaxID=241081 RepID=A0AAN6NYK6_9PEZI|nr:hypothetical protein QBC32DRAFT_121123 [Pseudoneurospora amorphoporcata]
MATDFVMPRFPNHQQQQPHFQQTYRGFHNNPNMNRQQPSSQQVSTGAPYQPPAQYSGHGNSQQISPLSTSGNVSPTSPKTLTRQIRPLYMPAALRPNQYASKPPTLRPSSKDEEIVEEQKLKPNTSYIGLGALGRLSRRNTGDSGMCIEPSVNLDHYPKPTGVPTRQHWKPDAESTVCDDARCKKNFNYFTRRHHCRRCGNIFCDVHSAFEIPLDQDANYNPRGTPSRACQHCYSQFKEWRSRANSQSSISSSSTSGDGNLTNSEPGSPVLASPTTPTGIKMGFNLSLPSMPEVAHSVPRDWNWSTF